MSKYFELHAVRPFGRKLNAVIEFIRYNRKSFGKAMLFIVGPFILAGTILLTNYFRFTMMQATNPEAGIEYLASPSFILSFIGAMVVLFLGSVAQVSTVYEYLILYEKKKTNDIPVREVWSRVKKNMWSLIGTLLVFAIGISVVGFVYAMFMVMLSMVHWFFTVLSVLALFVLIFFVMAFCMLTMCIQVYEGIGLSQAFGRASYLIRDNWWSTVGIILLLLFIQVTISYAFLIPVGVLGFISAMHTGGEFTQAAEDSSMVYMVLYFICYGLYTLANYMLYALPLLGVAFQYFNLVEKKEASGLLNRLDSFGQAKTENSDEEHY